jgi:AraC family transcriptional regulator
MAAPIFQPSGRRLTHIAEGRIQEDPGLLLLSSAKSSWAGFPIERHAVAPGSERHLFWPTPRLGLVARGAFKLEEETVRRQRRFLANGDSITIWPGGHESSRLRWFGSGEIIDVDIAPLPLALAGPAPGGVELTVQSGVHDPHLAAMVRAMEAEVRSGCPSGRLYGESLSLAVGAYIAARYAGTPPRVSQVPTQRVARHRLSRVLDFIHANLGRDLSIAELARIAHLSASHFTWVFRHSLGMSPHQYVMRERIAEAKRLLAAGGMSVAEVAFAVGFASQSHFGDIFRQRVGTTPRRYQEGL